MRYTVRLIVMLLFCASVVSAQWRPVQPYNMRYYGLRADSIVSDGIGNFSGTVTVNRITSLNFLPSNITQGAIDINRTINDGGFLNTRGFRDNSVFMRGSATPHVWHPNNDRYAYAGFDAVNGLEGAYFNHIVGFQSRPWVNITGEVSYIYGAFIRPNVYSGIADSAFGVRIHTPTNFPLTPGPAVGVYRNYFGLYIDSANVGTNLNYSIYSIYGQNYFNGNVGIGQGATSPAEALDVHGNSNVRGQLNIMGASANLINMSGVGVNPPQFTTRSNGTKIVLYPNLSGSMIDHSIGVESQHIWIGLPENSNARGVKIYGGITQVARISGTGMAFFGGSSSATSTLQSGGSLAAAHTATSGNLTLNDSHYTVRVTNSSHAITLPTASTCAGRLYILVNYNTGGNVTISSVNRNGAALTALPDNAKWTVQSDGTNWYVIQD